MKNARLFYYALLFVFILGSFSSANDETKIYGQTPPGLTPEVFAPDIVSTGSEFSCAMSPDGTEFYFSRFGTNPYHAMMYVQLSDSAITDAIRFPSLQNEDAWEPGLSRDGNTLYFITSKSVPGSTTGSIDLWRIERVDGEWSAPIHMESPFSEMSSLSVSISDNGTFYTTDNRRGQMGADIAITRKNHNGKYEDFTILPKTINTPGMDAYPSIAPDESYLIYTSMGDRKPELFVSFRSADGVWSQAQPIDLGELETVAPCLSHDGKYLFFTANSNIYWVSSEIFLQLKPE
ncbi:MAG: hypothetical protein V3V99_13400 [candidate division Zixibacteria bacterium]